MGKNKKNKIKNICKDEYIRSKGIVVVMRKPGVICLFSVYDMTIKLLPQRKEIVNHYDLVRDYDEAVCIIARFLNGHLRFTTDLQEDLPEMIILAWHYANKEYGCPMKDQEYEAFVEALRVDVYHLLAEWIKRDVGVKEWYGEKRLNKKI